jgi:thiol-disulfide isomerase/thioredoxin
VRSVSLRTLAACVSLAIVPTSNAADAPASDLSKALFSKPPALQLLDIDGVARPLSSFAGRVVIVHFFATWCIPCRSEMASLRSLVAETTSDLVILAINVGEPRKRVRDFFSKEPVRFPVLMDADRSATNAWDVSVLPTSFVLDRGHRARFFAEGDVDWSSPNVRRALQALAEEKRP